MLKTITLSLLLAAASNISAGTITRITYTGEVGDVHGDVSLFGPNGISARTPTTPGTPYSLVYTVNDAAPNATPSSTATSTRIEGVGVITAAITINGISQSISGSNQSSAENNDHQIISGVFTDRTYSASLDYNVTSAFYHAASAESYYSSNTASFLSTADYHVPFTYDATTGGSFYNYVYFNDFDYTTNTQNKNLYLNLSPGTVSAASVPDTGAATPEPSTFAIALGAFGTVAAMRHRVSRGRSVAG